MVDILLLILGIILIILGILGCILPIIPGPPLSFLGLLTLHYTKFEEFSSDFLVLWMVISILVTVLDYIVPVWGTKKFGGTKRGIWGATLGLFVGLFFFPPLGIVLGPFLGALVFEMTKHRDFTLAFKASLGSLFGFLVGTGIKLISSGVMTYHFVKACFV